MEISVAEAADVLGVSPRRVQVLLRGGRLVGRQVGRTWLVEESQLVRVARLSRPLSDRLACAVIAALSGDDPGVGPRDRSRLAALLADLRADPDPAARLASWIPPGPATVHDVAAPAADLLELRADARVRPTGVSDLRSGLVSTGQLEVRLWVRDLDGFVQDHLLSRAGPANVRVLLDPDPLPPGQVAFGRFLVDLSWHPGPRGSAAVHRLLSRPGRDC